MTQAGKHLYFVGNWKSHKSLAQALEFLELLSSFVPPSSVKVVICPPIHYLFPMHDYITKHSLPLVLGAQDVSPFPFGAYTGAVTAQMVQEVVYYVLVGHSERRKYFHESNEDVAQKARMALDSRLTPIICVDEPYLEAQLNYFTHEELAQCIVAYEPLSAIGSGHPDTPEHATEVIRRVKNISLDTPVLYGGSVTKETVEAFVNQPEIDGVLVGGASLQADTWKQLITAPLDK